MGNDVDTINEKNGVFGDPQEIGSPLHHPKAMLTPSGMMAQQRPRIQGEKGDGALRCEMRAQAAEQNSRKRAPWFRLRKI